MAKLNSAEQKILDDIAEWKTRGPGFLNRATHVVSKPLVWAGDKLIPDDVKGGMGKVTETIVEKLQDLSQWTVKEDEVLKATKEFEIDSDTIIELKKASIHDLDHVAEGFMKFNSQIAAAEGFGSGLIGWPGLIADLPALFTLCMRSLYQISLCYGYEVDQEGGNSEYEVGYMFRVFKIATASDKVEKHKGLMDLKDFEEAYNDEVEQAVAGDYTSKQVSKGAAIKVSSIIIREIIEQTFARKLVTLAPGIGAILTGGFNYAYVSDVGKSAFMLYRERFLLDKKGRKKVINIDID